jgi:signal transduction histidine kinase
MFGKTYLLKVRFHEAHFPYVQAGAQMPEGRTVGVPKGMVSARPGMGHTGGVITHGVSDRYTTGSSALGPLKASAYVAWLAVAGGPLWRALGYGIETPAQGLGVWALLLYFAMLVSHSIIDRRASSDRFAGLVVAVQALLAPVCIWMLSDNFQAVLLVVAVVQVAALRERRWAFGALAVANVALFIWLMHAMTNPKAIQMGFAYVAFQLFAGVVAHTAYAAQESQRRVARTNRELMAARVLVAEGARVQERLRVSRDLHDIAGHKLTALKLQLSLEIRTGASPASVTLARCLGLADELLTDMRAAVSALRREDCIDLQAALMALDPGIPAIAVTFEIEPDAIVPNIGKAEALLRCAQEGITNALRHGGATEIRVALRKSAHELALTVQDNGAGFAKADRPLGNGLCGLQERLQQFSGTVTLERLVSRGCVLRATLPDEASALC